MDANRRKSKENKWTQTQMQEYKENKWTQTQYKGSELFRVSITYKTTTKDNNLPFSILVVPVNGEHICSVS